MKAVSYVRIFAGVAAASALAAGLAALVAWGGGHWQVIEGGPQVMSPRTAALLVLLGLAQGLRALRPDSRPARVGASVVSALIILVALLALARTVWDLVPPWEAVLAGSAHPWIRLVAVPMVPTTAICFLLSAIALLARRRTWADSAAARWTASTATAGSGLVGGFIVLSYLIGAPPAPEEAGRSMSLMTGATFLVYNLAMLLALQGAEIESHWREALGPERRATNLGRLLVLAGVLLFCGAAGALLLHVERTEMRAKVQEQISAIAELKAAQLEAWRAEELHDAAMAAALPRLADILADPARRTAGDEAELRAALDLLRRSKAYRQVVVLDRTGRPVLELPAGAAADQAPVATLPTDATLARLIDFRRSLDGRVCLDILAPVRTVAGETVGELRVGIDPAVKLYPLIQQWPNASRSAEVALVRREGDTLVALNELRHLRGAALQLRRPLANPGLLAGIALRGERGLLEGTDYRGVESLGVGRWVADGTWLLVAKIDTAEAYGPVYDQVREILLGILLATGLVGLLLNGYWSAQRKSFAVTQLAAERQLRQAHERLALVMRHASDVMLLFDSRQRIVAANERVRQVYGYSPDEMLQLTARDLRTSTAGENTARDFAAALSRDSLAFETVHRRKDGTTFPVEVSTGRVELDGELHLLSIVRDGTERLAHRREIERLNRLYRVISEINQMLARTKTREELFQGCCRVLVETGGFRMAWIGLPAADGATVQVVATAGDELGYTSQLQIPLAGSSPTAQAMREDRAVVCADFLADPATAAWHDTARWSGIRSSIALPLHGAGRAIGVLSVYSTEVNAWSATEIGLLGDTARDVSFALEVFEQDARRRQAEASLRDREEIFSSIVGQAPDAIGLIDPATGRLIEFNQAAHDMLGYTREEFAGFGIPDIEADQNPEYVRSIMAGIMTTGGEQFETHHRHRDGRILAVRVSARAIRIQDKPCIAAIWSDITAAKRTEADMRKLTLAIEQSPASVIITDLAGTIEYVNPRFCSLTGYTAAEVVGRNPRLLKSELTLPSVYTDMWATITRGDVWRGELVNRRKDGTIFTEMALITPVHDGAGRVTHYVALKEDITERKKMESDLVLESQMLTNSMDGICLIRAADRRIIWTNRNFTEMYGFAPGELLNQPAANLNFEGLPGQPEAPGGRIEQELRATGHWAGDLRNVRRDGTECWSRVSCSGFTHADHGLLWVSTHHDITTRRANEAKLRQLSSIVEQAPLAIAITRLDGAIEYANPNFLAVTGYTLEELLGQNPRVLKSGLTPPAVYAEMWRTLSRGEVWQGELSNRKKSGEIFDELAVIAPVNGPDGRASHYVALKQDITAQKRAGQALRESEQRYRELFDLESDAILVLDAGTGRILQANEAADQAYGWPAGQLETVTIDQLVADPAAGRDLRASLGQPPGEVIRIPEQRHLRRNGTGFPVEIALRVFQRDGQLLAVTAIRDITAQVEARRRLELFNAELETNVRLRTEEIAARNREIEALLQSIPDLVLRLRADGTVLNFQPAKGDSPLAELPATHGTSHPFGSDLLRLAAETGARALAGATTAVAEGELNQAGRRIIAELRAAPVGTEEFVVFARDITARKHLEREVGEMLEKERQVSEMKTRFISLTSHEFRTPMAAAMGSVEILANHLDQLTPAKRQELFQRVNTSLHRMTAMLDEVLLLNRIDSARVEVSLAPVNLLQCARNVIEEIRLGDREGHQYELEATGADRPFRTDQKLLHHILTNLLSNAGRYSPAGTKVTLRLTVTAASATCCVIDEGIGVPEADRGRIFEPFERGSNVGTRKGTGLGLNIVKRMTGLLGGAIAIEPIPTGGTCFTLTLPAPPPA